MGNNINFLGLKAREVVDYVHLSHFVRIASLIFYKPYIQDRVREHIVCYLTDN